MNGQPLREGAGRLAPDGRSASVRPCLWYGRNRRTDTEQAPHLHLGDLAQPRQIPPGKPARKPARFATRRVLVTLATVQRRRRLGPQVRCPGGSAALTRHELVQPRPSRSLPRPEPITQRRSEPSSPECRTTGSRPASPDHTPHALAAVRSVRTIGRSFRGRHVGSPLHLFPAVTCPARPFVGAKPCLSKHERYREQDPTGPSRRVPQMRRRAPEARHRSAAEVVLPEMPSGRV